MNFAKFCTNLQKSRKFTGGFSSFSWNRRYPSISPIIEITQYQTLRVRVWVCARIFLWVRDYDPTITVLAEAHDTKITHAPEALLSGATPRTLRHTSTQTHYRILVHGLLAFLFVI